MSGSVARNVSGFWVRYGQTHKPGALVTGDAENEIPRGLCRLMENCPIRYDSPLAKKTLIPAFVSALALCLTVLSHASAGEAGYRANPVQPVLGDPPGAPTDVSALPRSDGRFAASGLAVSTTDRAAVARFYRLYKAANLVPSEWSGGVANCQAGSTGLDYKEVTRQQINFFRAMAGVPASVSIDSGFSAKGQQAALMFSANGQLDHFPPSTWRCYTANGAEAAGKSNLALGNAGPNAVKGYMDDSGTNNAFVGHRRWVLYPQTQLMGTGDVTDAPNGGYDANALWVQDGNYFSVRPPVRDDFVAWPPTGYIPYDLVPARWSFSYPNADFSAASVSVTRDGQILPAQLETVANGYGENTLVWVVDNRTTSASSVLPRPSADTPYHVVISGARIGGQARNFDYTVIVFDADPAVPPMSFLPAQPNLTVGRSITLTVSGISGSIAGAGWSGSRVFDLQFASSTSIKLTGIAPGSATLNVTDTGGYSADVEVSVASQGSISDWQISGRADGNPEAMTLVADVLPASLDDSRTGAYFVAAQLPNGSLYLNNGQGWVSFTGGPIPARSTGSLTQRSFPVFVGLDTRGLSGTQVLVGYGTDANDMLSNTRYRAIYTIP